MSDWFDSSWNWKFHSTVLKQIWWCLRSAYLVFWSICSTDFLYIFPAGWWSTIVPLPVLHNHLSWAGWGILGAAHLILYVFLDALCFLLDHCSDTHQPSPSLFPLLAALQAETSMYCEEFLCFDISGIYLLPWPVLILPGILMTGRAYVLMASIFFISFTYLLNIFLTWWWLIWSSSSGFLLVCGITRYCLGFQLLRWLMVTLLLNLYPHIRVS